MPADGVLHHGCTAEIVRRGKVDMVDQTEAVAAQLQRIGKFAEAVFAGVEGACPAVVGGVVGVSGALSIGRIAEALGYADPTVFRRAFRAGGAIRRGRFARLNAGRSHALNDTAVPRRRASFAGMHAFLGRAMD